MSRDTASRDVKLSFTSRDAVSRDIQVPPVDRQVPESPHRPQGGITSALREPQGRRDALTLSAGRLDVDLRFSRGAHEAWGVIMTSGTLPSQSGAHMIIRPSFTVLGGDAIGLVAGAAVYGAVSSSADQTSTPAKATVAAV